MSTQQDRKSTLHGTGDMTRFGLRPGDASTADQVAPGSSRARCRYRKRCPGREAAEVWGERKRRVQGLRWSYSDARGCRRRKRASYISVDESRRREIHQRSSTSFRSYAAPPCGQWREVGCYEGARAGWGGREQARCRRRCSPSSRPPTRSRGACSGAFARQSRCRQATPQWQLSHSPCCPPWGRWCTRGRR
ncbi:unnamed protein product [Ectocarpus sp. 12 AP-2014]